MPLTPLLDILRTSREISRIRFAPSFLLYPASLLLTSSFFTACLTIPNTVIRPEELATADALLLMMFVFLFHIKVWNLFLKL